jgi:hypothetical protein
MEKETPTIRLTQFVASLALLLGGAAAANEVKLQPPVHPARILKVEQGRRQGNGYVINVTFQLHCGERFVEIVSPLREPGSEHTGRVIGALVEPSGVKCAAADTAMTRAILLPVPDVTGYNFSPLAP